jgi:N-acetylmuramoyl-L-alanine amidase
VWLLALKIKTVVIDPGHGGHDSGCLGSSAKEKHVALAVSLKLGKLIEEKY